MDATEHPIFTAVLDACVLYPLPLRDTLLRAAEAGLYRPYWSDNILAEVTRNLIKRGKVNPEQADRLQEVLRAAFPRAAVTVPEVLVATMTNNPKDRHVLAVAVRAGAQFIVTANLNDFKEKDLQSWNVIAQHPDAFLCHLYYSDPEAMARVIVQQSQALKRPPIRPAELLALLKFQVPEFVQLVSNNLTN